MSFYMTFFHFEGVPKMFENQFGGGDTAHSNLGHLVTCSNKGGVTVQNSKMLEKQRGAMHIPFYGTWSKEKHKVG